MRIAIATSGRFHVLDLARELAQLGHEVRLYSMLPDTRVEKFGLDRRLHQSLLPIVAPLVAWQRYAPHLLPELHDWLFSRVLDHAVASILAPCDVLICMSGIFVSTIKVAKRRHGAHVWLERGSRHILSQAEILGSIPGARGPTRDNVSRELQGYQLADRIVVPSRHAAASFGRDAEASGKLFIDAYGTDLISFPYRVAGSLRSPLRLVFAGIWSLQKGCDVLVEAVRTITGVKLLHVGNVGDFPFPSNDHRFQHVPAVPQSALSRFYRESDGFILASRQEGLSMVQAQALASGLPIICTDMTGGEDLAHTPALRDRIDVVAHGDATALGAAIKRLRQRLANGPAFALLSAEDLATLSWAAYAKRYHDELTGT